jgi:signal transduction histidine kinase
LEQFAFLAAHNLRAPVARIMGLGNLFTLNPNITNQETKIIISMLTAATKELDEVIQDLSSVLELRDNISKSIATVNFSAELELIISNLEKEIVETNTIIEASFVEAPEVIAVKAYIDSILFNLINNAIKYRQADRSPVVKIKSYTIPKYICLAISDNGVGIPKKHLNKIFNFYSRFHFHVGGKGLGLFLVNSQVMAMGGIVKVKSKINEGTTFKIYFRKNLKKSQHQLSKKMLSIPNEKG